jgi:hypothetical protein
VNAYGASCIPRQLTQVPHVMTDTVIPPAATANNVRVTIMDTSGAPLILILLVGHAYVIILQYMYMYSAVLRCTGSASQSACHVVSIAAPARREELHTKLRKADSVIVVYDITRRDTFDNLGTKWLPLLNEYCHGKPAVVVAAKAGKMCSYWKLRPWTFSAQTA